jgi:hypothetical protein
VASNSRRALRDEPERSEALVRRELELDRHDVEDLRPIRLVGEAVAQHPLGVLAIREDFDDLEHPVVGDAPESQHELSIGRTTRPGPVGVPDETEGCSTAAAARDFEA